MSDLVERLRGYASDDHERGCQGRYYDCSCGYDGKRDPLMIEAADRIEQLEDALIDAGASLAAAISLLERGGKKAAASDKMFAVMLSDYQKSMDRARAALEERT
jgi:hypothetical protein